MRNELNEVCRIEHYLLRQLTEEETRAFEAALVLDQSLADKVETQRTAYKLIHRYGRNQQRRWLESIYRRLLEEPAFAQQINRL